MKKLTAFFLAIIFALTPLSVYAQEPPAETQIMMGDVTNDKKVTAADARAVLRMAASIDSKDGISMLAADADANGKITAADARLILRVSAKQTSFTCGFDADGNLNAVNVIKRGVYALDAYSIEGSETLPIFMAFNDQDFCLKNIGTFIDDEPFVISDPGTLFLDGKSYIIASWNGVPVRFSEESIESLLASSPSDDNTVDDFDFSELTIIADFMDSFISEDIGIPQKVVADGDEYFVYHYTLFGQAITLTADSHGRIVSIAADDGSRKLLVNSLSGDISDDIFDLKKYIPL